MNVQNDYYSSDSCSSPSQTVKLVKILPGGEIYHVVNKNCPRTVVLVRSTLIAISDSLSQCLKSDIRCQNLYPMFWFYMAWQLLIQCQNLSVSLARISDESDLKDLGFPYKSTTDFYRNWPLSMWSKLSQNSRETNNLASGLIYSK